MKTEPGGSHLNYNLQYTPTFILLDGENEQARVVERPVKSVLEDLVLQLQRDKGQ